MVYPYGSLTGNYYRGIILILDNKVTLSAATASNALERKVKMATVHLVSIQVTDDAGKAQSVLYPIPSTASLAEVQDFVTEIAPLMDAVTGGKITNASVALNLTLPAGLKAAALADHPVQYGANFSFSAANTTYNPSIRMPALDQGLIEAGEVVDVGSVIADWTAKVINATGPAKVSDKYANDIDAYLGAEITFRKK